MSRPLSRKEASTYPFDRHGISRTIATLAKLAVTGGGPRFRKAGKATLYDIAFLDEYAVAITSEPVSSTSELRGAE